MNILGPLNMLLVLFFPPLCILPEQHLHCTCLYFTVLSGYWAIVTLVQQLSLCICSSRRAGGLRRMGEVPDCSVGTLRRASFSCSFVCSTNHVGQIRQQAKRAAAPPGTHSPSPRMGTCSAVALCSLSTDLPFYSSCVPDAL